MYIKPFIVRMQVYLDTHMLQTSGSQTVVREDFQVVREQRSCHIRKALLIRFCVIIPSYVMLIRLCAILILSTFEQITFI